MEADFIELIAKLRISIGYLGEKEQFGWWQSSFFTQGNEAFLSPLFGRTQVLAQCNGVTQAAALVHDERIGVGNVYHLFRLPEDMEQNIHKALHDIKPNQLVANTDAAMEYLHKKSVELNQSGLGPTRVGDKKSLSDIHTWKQVAALYHAAFEKRIEIYPYFADIS